MGEDIEGRVLYIEDDPVSVLVLRGMLDAFPRVQLAHAATGLAGLAAVQRDRPDFVLLDMHLPDISGLEVVRRLNDDIAARRLRITILTGDPLNLDVVKAMSLGAYEYWTKPLDKRLFVQGLRRALSGASAHPGHTLQSVR